MLHYAPVYSYPSILSETGELFRTIDAAKTRDREIIVDELSGLTPEFVEQLLAEGMSERHRKMVEMLLAISDEARWARTEPEVQPRAPLTPAVEQCANPIGCKSDTYWDDGAEYCICGLSVSARTPGKTLSMARARGVADFRAGKPGMVPADLRGDKQAHDAWLEGWDEASVAAAQTGGRVTGYVVVAGRAAE